MALDLSNLTRLAGGSGVNLWYYTSNDALSVVRAANYFSTADATGCLLYTSPSPRDSGQSRMPSSA